MYHSGRRGVGVYDMGMNNNNNINNNNKLNSMNGLNGMNGMNNNNNSRMKMYSNNQHSNTTPRRYDLNTESGLSQRLPNLRYHVFISKETTAELANYIMPESWAIENGLLYKYLDYIWRCQLFDGQIRKFFSRNEAKLVFHSGLQRRSDGEYVYLLLILNEGINKRVDQKWRVALGIQNGLHSRNMSFVTKDELLQHYWRFDEHLLPRRTLFYESEKDLIFRSNYRFEIDWDERLRTCKNRIYKALNMDENALPLGQLHRRLESETMKSIALSRANPRIGVPQAFIESKNAGYRLELLIPLTLYINDKVYYFALALRPHHNEEVYEGMSILTREMAYANARLVGYIDSSWLTMKFASPQSSVQSVNSVGSKVDCCECTCHNYCSLGINPNRIHNKNDNNTMNNNSRGNNNNNMNSNMIGTQNRSRQSYQNIQNMHNMNGMNGMNNAMNNNPYALPTTPNNNGNNNANMYNTPMNMNMNMYNINTPNPYLMPNMLNTPSTPNANKYNMTGAIPINDTRALASLINVTTNNQLPNPFAPIATLPPPCLQGNAATLPIAPLNGWPSVPLTGSFPLGLPILPGVNPNLNNTQSSNSVTNIRISINNNANHNGNHNILNNHNMQQHMNGGIGGLVGMNGNLIAATTATTSSSAQSRLGLANGVHTPSSALSRSLSRSASDTTQMSMSRNGQMIANNNGSNGVNAVNGSNNVHNNVCVEIEKPKKLCVEISKTNSNSPNNANNTLELKNTNINVNANESGLSKLLKTNEPNSNSELLNQQEGKSQSASVESEKNDCNNKQTHTPKPKKKRKRKKKPKHDKNSKEQVVTASVPININTANANDINASNIDNNIGNVDDVDATFNDDMFADASPVTKELMASFAFPQEDIAFSPLSIHRDAPSKRSNNNANIRRTHSSCSFADITGKMPSKLSLSGDHNNGSMHRTQSDNNFGRNYGNPSGHKRLAQTAHQRQFMDHNDNDNVNAFYHKHVHPYSSHNTPVSAAENEHDHFPLTQFDLTAQLSAGYDGQQNNTPKARSYQQLNMNYRNNNGNGNNNRNSMRKSHSTPSLHDLETYPNHHQHHHHHNHNNNRHHHRPLTRNAPAYHRNHSPFLHDPSSTIQEDGNQHYQNNQMNNNYK